MNTAASVTRPFAGTAQSGPGGIRGLLGSAQIWLDERGKKAWIAAMILGFIFAWPVGLGLLFYMIWSKRMFGHSSCGHRGHQHPSRADWDDMRQQMRGMGRAMRPTGNAAFDAYKAETIHRLQEEQEAFEAFLQRLREAKDKSEFDTFMEDRAKANASADAGATTASDAAPAPRTGEY